MLPAIPIGSLAVLAVLLSSSVLQTQTRFEYQVPPQAIVDRSIHDRPLISKFPPATRQAITGCLIEPISGLPPVAELAQPEFRLAGLRFNPRTNGPSRGRYITSLRLKALPNGEEKAVSGLPPNAKIRLAAWSPDAQHVHFVNTTDNSSDAGLSLWIVDVEAGTSSGQLKGGKTTASRLTKTVDLKDSCFLSAIMVRLASSTKYCRESGDDGQRAIALVSENRLGTYPQSMCPATGLG